jgi:hypothetical protein
VDWLPQSWCYFFSRGPEKKRSLNKKYKAIRRLEPLFGPNLRNADLKRLKKNGCGGPLIALGAPKQEGPLGKNPTYLIGQSTPAHIYLVQTFRMMYIFLKIMCYLGKKTVG